MYDGELKSIKSQLEYASKYTIVRAIRIEMYPSVQHNGIHPVTGVIRNHGLVNESVAGSA